LLLKSEVFSILAPKDDPKDRLFLFRQDSSFRFFAILLYHHNDEAVP